MPKSRIRTADDGSLEKRCPRCMEWKLATLRYFDAYAKAATGLASWCKVCKREDDRYHNDRQPQKYGQTKDGLRCCTQCKKWKPDTAEFFHWKRYLNHSDPMCKDCIKYKREIREQTNPDRIRAIQRRYYAKHREEIRDYGRRWYRKNTHKVSEYHQRSRERHPETPMIMAERRRARKASLPADFKRADWRRCLNYWHHCCAYCGNQRGFLPGMELTADHFIPLSSSICPGTVPENIVPACGSCNSSKSNQEPQKWLQRRFGRTRTRRIITSVTVYFDTLKQGSGND